MGETLIPVTLAAGASLPAVAPLRGRNLRAIHVPPGAAGSWLAFRRAEGAAAGYRRSWTGAKLTAAFAAGSWLELAADDVALADGLQVEVCGAEAGTPQPQGDPPGCHR